MALQHLTFKYLRKGSEPTVVLFLPLATGTLGCYGELILHLRRSLTIGVVSPRVDALYEGVPMGLADIATYVAEHLHTEHEGKNVVLVGFRSGADMALAAGGHIQPAASGSLQVIAINPTYDLKNAPLFKIDPSEHHPDLTYWNFFSQSICHLGAEYSLLEDHSFWSLHSTLDKANYLIAQAERTGTPILGLARETPDWQFHFVRSLISNSRDFTPLPIPHLVLIVSELSHLQRAHTFINTRSLFASCQLLATNDTGIALTKDETARKIIKLMGLG
ncbi:hypothetical protein [Pseudomonas sp. LRF_L74]|uniref:hypothetical protein n=1 Tax=Pseudomonas sp. LRF_L74 TaxID=3369422 RepID=UPI003F614708